MPPCDLICNLRHTVALYAQPEYVPNHLGGLFVHDPVRFVLPVLYISVWRIRAERLAGLSLCLEYGAYLAAGVLRIKFVKNMYSVSA